MNEQDRKREEGFWPADDIRYAFVAGAKWWEFQSQGATMWPSDIDKAEAEAERRYPSGSAAALARARREGIEAMRDATLAVSKHNAIFGVSQIIARESACLLEPKEESR